jgi:hypothetical protein
VRPDAIDAAPIVGGFATISRAALAAVELCRWLCDIQ